ncbi:VRR-NUC domain-containing protein [Clostridium sp. KNHs214]|uniref:VRR-NUC domain-containing protein n=1 Tax=Clostridium sp. KNHs214 TaxID=1540257 RepID=UPI000555B218|nr:VRR-NUC domain-containing protein [Clostridium sp. KNHs214]
MAVVYSEKSIEQALTKEVKKRGGLALKFISPGMIGVPDRLILMKGGKLAFIELKAPKKKMRPLQIKRKSQLEVLGFSVYCIDNKEQIGGVLDEICAT